MMNNQLEEVPQRKFILNFKKHPVIDVRKINQFIEIVNQKDFGCEVRLEHVLAYFIENYKESDIEGIQTRGLTPWDKVKRKYLLEKQGKGLEISLEEYVAQKMKV